MKRNNKSKAKPYLTPNEVAGLLMISPITVRQLAQKGDIAAEITPGGHRRFLKSEVIRFAKQRGLNLQTFNTDVLRILIVDDDKQFSHFLAELISTQVPTAITAICNDAFNAGMKIHSFNPDIVLLDIMMPNLNGVEVCQLIKDNPATSRIRVIAITGNASNKITSKIIAVGAEVCLAKPIDAKEIFTVIGIDNHHQSSD